MTQAQGSTPSKTTFADVVNVSKWAFTESKALTKGTLFLVFFTSLLTQVQSIASTSLYGYLMGSITLIALTPGHSLQELLQPFSIYTLFAVIVEVLKQLSTEYMAKARTQAETTIKTAYLEKLMQSQEKDIEAVFPEEEQSQAFADVVKIYTQFMTIINIIVSIISAIVIAIYLGYFSYLLPIALIPLALINFFVDRFSRGANAKTTKNLQPILQRVRDSVSAFTSKNWRPVIKQYGVENKVIVGYTKWINHYNQKTASSKKFWSNVAKFASVVSNISGIFILSLVLYNSPELMAIGSIYVQLQLVNLFKGKVEAASLSLNSLEELTPTVAKYIKAFSWPIAADSRQLLTDTTEPKITFEGVAYNTPQSVIFRGFTLDIAAGAITGLYLQTTEVSHFMSLLMGTRKPLAGRVLVQGVDAHTINSKWFNKHVGVVSAERLLSFLTFADQFDVGGTYSFEPTAFESYAALVGFVTHRQRADFWYQTPKRWKERKSFKALEMVQFLLARELYQQKPFIMVNARSFALSREEELALVHLLHYIRMTYNKTIVVAVTYITSLYYTDNVAYFSGGKIAEYGSTQALLVNEMSVFGKQYRQVQEKLAQEAQSIISSSSA